MNSTAIDIKLAVPEDSEQIAELEFASFGADNTSVIASLIYPPASDDVQAERIKTTAGRLIKGIKSGKRKIIKAEMDGKITGYAMYIPSEQEDFTAPEGNHFMARFMRQLNKTRQETVGGTQYWKVEMLAVDPRYWRRGVGSALIQWGIDQVRDESIDLYVEASLMGEAFYSKLGFKTIGWDQIQDANAPDGVCKWPYMIRKSQGK